MKIIITGATGMVGEGVLMECLSNPLVTEILSVSRKHCGMSHPKLKEYLVKDFLNLQQGDENLKGYDACFFCAGVSSVGMTEIEFSKVTYDTTLNFAKALSPMSEMTFNYISGVGTDSTEKGRVMWARIKGRTENDLLKLHFKNVFAFRPGLLKFSKGQKRTKLFFRIMNTFYPIFRILFPSMSGTVTELTNAMIHASKFGYEKNVLEVIDIRTLSKLYLQ